MLVRSLVASRDRIVGRSHIYLMTGADITVLNH